LGTHRQHEKKEKVPPPSPLPYQKEKNWTSHESMLSLSLAVWKFYFPKLFVTIFGLG
jgi:hypothetical protein